MIERYPHVQDETENNELRRYAERVGEEYHTCDKCRIPYVTSPSHRHPSLCIDCSGLRQSFDYDLRRKRQKVYKQTFKERGGGTKPATPQEGREDLRVEGPASS